MTEEVLLYDIVHDYIISENFASDTEGANKVMLKLSDELMQEIYERTMTASEKRKDTMLKKKYDDSDMKKNMQAQYGKEEGKKVYFATIRKQAMKEAAPLAAITKGAVRAGIKVAGKTGGKVVKTVIKKGGEELKKQAIQTAGEVATNAAKKIGEKTREKANEKIGVREEDENKEDPSIKAKLERQAMIKKQVLMKKLQAVRAGAGADITSSYKPDGEILQERQKTNQGHRQSEEQHRSNYGKASVRNMRAFGKGGNAADPAERLVAMDARHKAHKEKRGVKTKGMKEEVKRDQYGDPIGGPKISKKQLKKNLTANTPDEQHTTTTSEAAAWTKKSGKNPSGGLNEKGRKSYERENPGSDLKRPSKKVGNKRRASFCARMKGMKKKLTSSKTANDPDSRINKSLRAWNC